MLLYCMTILSVCGQCRSSKVESLKLLFTKVTDSPHSLKRVCTLNSAPSPLSLPLLTGLLLLVNQPSVILIRHCKTSTRLWFINRTALTVTGTILNHSFVLRSQSQYRYQTSLDTYLFKDKLLCLEVSNQWVTIFNLAQLFQVNMQ